MFRVCGQAFPGEILGGIDSQRPSMVRRLRGGSGETIHAASSTVLARESTGGDLPRDRGAMTFPMTFAYTEAYAAARSCLGALADTSDFHDSCRYERALIDLDAIHRGDFPATHPMPGTRPELLAHLEDDVDR